MKNFDSMKRILITLLAALISAAAFGQTQEANTSRTNIPAEEELLVGEWSGLFKSAVIEGDNFVEHDFKLVILINKYGDTFRIRAKSIDLDDSQVTYRPEAKVVFCDGQNISWVHYLGEDWDWSGNSRHKGRIVGHSSYKLICRASYKDGVLLYHDWQCATYYDKSGNIIEEESEADVYKGLQREITMYKDDNW